MRDYQSLQIDSQSLQNPAEMRFYWNFAVLKNATDTCTCMQVQVDHRVS